VERGDHWAPGTVGGGRCCSDGVYTDDQQCTAPPVARYDTDPLDG